ncbi:MAG TPA: MFS transporter [Levilinea sp.]|nr:MFS transporter [Levilinea sp.]
MTITTAKSGNPGYRRLLHNRHFMALWISQLVSFIGDYLEWLAIPILVQNMTGSTLMVGLALIANSIPALLLGPVAGVFVDRWDRKKTMIVADILRALLILVCLTVQSPEQVWVYFVVGFGMSSISRFFYPALNASLPLIVTDKDDLLVANGMMQIVQTVGLLAGPAIAGFVIGLWGAPAAFMIDSITFLISALAIITITVPHTTRGNHRLNQVWSELKEGTAYLVGNPVMRSVMNLMAVVMLGAGAINVLWIPYLFTTFGVGPEGIGIVDSAQGIGMVIGGLALGAVSVLLNKALIVGLGVIIVGAGFSAMGLAPNFAMIVILNIIVGIAMIPAQSVLYTLMQTAVPDIQRGRVGSGMNAITTATSLASMAVASLLGDAIGLRVIFVVCGVITMLGGLLGMWSLLKSEQTTLQAVAGLD